MPEQSEWSILEEYIGGASVAGGMMKEAGVDHWASPNTGATNSSGFTALPGGYRHSAGTFVYRGTHGDWWGATYDVSWSNGSITEDINQLTSGTYTYTITDANNCIVTNDLQIFKIENITDIDGNQYDIVKINDQIWMAENLKNTKFNDGTSIPNVIDNTVWSNLSTAAYCWYNNDEPTYKDAYGALYSWYSVQTNKLCLSGWHVPSNSEWKTLEMHLGMTQAEADATPPTGWRGTDQGTQLKNTSML